MKIIDQRTIGDADYRGNRQYLSVGNLRQNDRVSIVAIAYVRQKRLKLWGHVRITENSDIVDLLNGADGTRPDRGIVIRVVAFDWNCPKHIPLRLTNAERDNDVTQLRDRMGDLARKTGFQRELSV